VIDLHLHTRASDGAFEPPELVRRAWLAGIRTLSVTDHDTVAGLDSAASAAAQHGMNFVPGIEVTAVDAGLDVHVLGYFIDRRSSVLADFLVSQRADRVRRLHELAAKLGAAGMKIDVDRIIAETPEGRAVGRPLVAQALVRAGFVRTISEAFDRWIGEGCPAFVARAGASPEAVIELIHQAGGLASIAHPGSLGRDDLVERIAANGLDAVEVYHPDHDEPATARYLDLKTRFKLFATGGSDYHRDDEEDAAALGRVTLPAADFELLSRRAS
jgi:predicted metal-dependent phosphoesterase TrpH